MGNTFNLIEPLIETIEDYGKTSFELYKLKIISKTAEIISAIATRLAVIIVLSMSLIFASIGLSLWLGDLLGKPYLGFFCVAIFYIVLGAVIFYILRNYIKRKIGNIIILEVFKK